MDILEFFNRYKGKKVRIMKPDSSHYTKIGIIGNMAGGRHCSVLIDNKWRSYAIDYLVPAENYKVIPLPLPG